MTPLAPFFYRDLPIVLFIGNINHMAKNCSAMLATGAWVLKVKDDPGDPDFLQRQLDADPSAPSLPTADQVASDMSSTPYGTSPWDNTS